MKHIAVISYHTCPLSDEKDAEIGGMNTYILGLSKALSEVGYAIDIYTRMVDKNSPEVADVNPNLRVIHIQAGQTIDIPTKGLSQYIPEFVENYNKFIAKEKLSYDLISCHYYLSGLIGLEIKKIYNTLLFITFHTLALMKNLVAKNEKDREDLFRIKAELLLVNKADKVIATSNNDREYLNALYDCDLHKIAVLTPGVDLKLFRPINKSLAKKKIQALIDCRLILFVGRIEPLKGIDVILYAVKILKHQSPSLKFCLWIVGGNNIKNKNKWSAELKRLEQIRELLGLHSYVKFAGKKDRAQLPFYYNSAEVVLLPSQYESFGMSALEAMACGVSVITTDATGISEILVDEPNFEIISVSNPIMLAQKIGKLLTRPQKKNDNEVIDKVRNLSGTNIDNKFDQIFSK